MITITNLDEHIANQTIEFPDGMVKFGDLLSIDRTDLQEDFAKHSARLAWLNMLTAEAKAAYEQAKAETKRLYAELDKEVRDNFAENFIKTTETMVKSEILRDPDYMKTQKKEFEILHQSELLSGMARAFYQRGELLQSIGALYRQEQQFADLKTKLKG